MQIPGIDPNKLKGGWKMVRDLIADTVGPMGLLAIAAGSFVKASAQQPNPHFEPRQISFYSDSGN